MPRSGAAVCIKLGGETPSTKAMKPDIGRESQFLPTPPAF